MEKERKRIGSDLSCEESVFDNAGERSEGLLSDQVVRRGCVGLVLVFFFLSKAERKSRMGGVCGACGGSSPHKEKYQQHQNSFQQGSQPQYRPQEKVSVPQRTTEEDRARMDEARSNAAIAAQKRSVYFFRLLCYVTICSREKILAIRCTPFLTYSESRPTLILYTFWLGRQFVANSSHS